MELLRSTCFVLLAAGVLSACQHRHTLSYPRMSAAGALEATFDCEALDDAILKTDAVRWAIRQDGGRLITAEDRAGRRIAGVAANVQAHAALDHADRRLVSLLALKKTAACGARATGTPHMTDLELHDVLTALLADESPDAAFDERTRLLDRLRP